MKTTYLFVMENGQNFAICFNSIEVISTVSPEQEGLAGDEKIMPKNVNKNEEKKQDQEETAEVRSMLVGYARRSNAGGAIKLSINTSAFSDCTTYVTSDGQAYVPLIIGMHALQKVISGERAVTTVTQLQD